jgi:glycosyltransferase involved in cell wall biosynthesis
MTAKISIVTPCYNAKRYIDETILGVITQKGDFEIQYLILDGGSTDGTLDIIERFKNMIDSGSFIPCCRKVSLTYNSEPDQGMYDALAKGFRMVTGDIVAYINSDDYYLPNAFSVITEIYDSYPDVEWLTGMHLFYNEKGSIMSTWLPFKYDKDWIGKGMYGTILPFVEQETTFWRRRLLDFVDFQKLKEYKFAGDFYLWHTFCQHSDLHIVNSCLGGFRFSNNQLSKQLDKYYEEFLNIADPKTRMDRIVGRWIAKLTKRLSDKYKMLLNCHIIRYHNGQWWKPDTARRDKLKSFVPSHQLRSLLSRIVR